MSGMDGTLGRAEEPSPFLLHGCSPSPTLHTLTLPVAGLSGTLSPCSISHVGPMSESSPASSGSVKSQEKTLLASEQEEAR